MGKQNSFKILRYTLYCVLYEVTMGSSDKAEEK